MIRVLVYRVGDEPKVEEVENPFVFTKSSVLKGGHLEYLNFLGPYCVMEDEEAPMKKLPYNKSIFGIGKVPPKDVSFLVFLGEHAARPGEPGLYHIAGNFVISKRDHNGHHVSLSHEEVIDLVAFIDATNPPCAFCKKRSVAYPGAVYCGAACSAQAGA